MFSICQKYQIIILIAPVATPLGIEAIIIPCLGFPDDTCAMYDVRFLKEGFRRPESFNDNRRISVSIGDRGQIIVDQTSKTSLKGTITKIAFVAGLVGLAAVAVGLFSWNK